MNIIDQWYRGDGDETLSEYVSTRSEMDYLACHTIDQEWLAYEAEEATTLTLEKSTGLIFDSLMPHVSSGISSFPNPYYLQEQMQQQMLQQHGLLRGLGGILPWH